MFFRWHEMPLQRARELYSGKKKPRLVGAVPKLCRPEAVAARPRLNGASCLFSSLPSWQVFSWPLSWLASWRLFSWQASSQPFWAPVSSWPVSFSPWACRLRRSGPGVRGWGLEARERAPVRRLQEPAGRILLPPLPLRNPLPATRYKRRCRRILPLRHVRRAWDRRTSLFLLISVAAGCARGAWLRAQRI